MAAVTELSFLLFALINNIHAEELIIEKEGNSYTFNLPKAANSCLISRFVGEEKLVLWNTSDLWSQNSTVPEDLKRRLVSRPNISSYMIHNLMHSDSGLYQEECWTNGNMTHEENITLTICSLVVEIKYISVRFGETVDLPCFGAADNLDVQWLKRYIKYKETMWTRVFGDNTTSVMGNVKERYQLVTNTSALRVSSVTITYTLYTCLTMNEQRCVSSHPVKLNLHTETIYHSVEETVVLPCTASDFTDDQPPQWKTPDQKMHSYLGQQNQTVTLVDQNYSLVLTSLTLNHTGFYSCLTSMGVQFYFMVVCRKFGPPAVELFSEGQEVTLRCRDLEKGERHLWFIKANRTEGRIIRVKSELSRVSRYSNGSLVITNVSLEDTGEYWCAVIDPYVRCVSTTRILLQYKEPSGIHSTFYTARCSVLSGLLVMLCVVVAVVNQRTRRAERQRLNMFISFHCL